MPLDVLGCTRATLMRSMSLCACLKRLDNLHNAYRDGDKRLQLFFLNEEFLVCTSHQLVLITSLPFVHTARRSYRLSVQVNNLDCVINQFAGRWCGKSYEPYHLEEGEVVTRFP